MNLDFVKDVSSLAKGVMSGAAPDVVPKEIANGLIVSTIDSHDLGYETALMDKSNTFVVERYDSEEEARVGHSNWVKKCEDGIETITTLGYKSLVDEKNVPLERMSEEEANKRLAGVTGSTE